MSVVVVGCGHWGKNLIRNFAEIGGLYGVCDSKKETTQKIAEQYGVVALTYDEALVSDCQGIVIAAPAPCHAELAIKAFAANKHVYVEKPLAMNLDEAEQIIQAGHQSGKHLMVGHLLQYHPVFVALREKVQAGDLGKINYLYSNRLSLGKVRVVEDVMWCLAPHDVSMLLSLVQAPVKSVLCNGAEILQENIADTVTLHIEFENGLKAHVFASWIHPYKEQKLVVVGEKGMAVFDDTQPWAQKLAIYAHTIDLSVTPPLLETADVHYVDVPEGEPLKSECQYFLDLMASKVPPLTDGVEGMAVLSVLSAASASLKSNERVYV